MLIKLIMCLKTFLMFLVILLKQQYKMFCQINDKHVKIKSQCQLSIVISAPSRYTLTGISAGHCCSQVQLFISKTTQFYHPTFLHSLEGVIPINKFHRDGDLLCLQDLIVQIEICYGKTKYLVIFPC